MDCEDVRRILPDIIEDGGNIEFKTHLNVCPECSTLVADLEAVASGAKELAGSEEPPARVWVKIANQLRAEGIIRDPGTVLSGPVLVPARRRRWNVWWLVPVAAAIIAASAYQLAHRTPSPSIQQAGQPTASTASEPSAGSKQVAESSAREVPAMQAAKTPASGKPSNARATPPAVASAPERAEISAPPAEDDERFLSTVSEGAPTVRATYGKQLRAVNEEIRETQEYIKRHPDDLDARQHLMEVYQQKAMLYQMALDRIQ